jgi:hypothetical protein
MLDQIPLAEIEQISYTTDIDRLLLTKSHNTVLTVIIVPLTLFPLSLLFLVRLGVYTQTY